MWVKAEYQFGSLFSYRIPDFSSQYALTSPLPGPSTIKLAMVATAIEQSKNPNIGGKIFEIMKRAQLQIARPKKIALSNVLIRRLKKKKGEMGFERTFGIRGYVHLSDSLRVYAEIKENEKEEIKNLLRKVRQLGTSDSIVYCKSVSEEEPPKGCIKPIKNLEKLEKNTLIIPVKDLNPDPKNKFEDLNKSKKKRSVFIKVFYPIPISKQMQGKNWIVYEVKQ